MQDIVGLLFKYIKLLQQSGASKWIFDEVRWYVIYIKITGASFTYKLWVHSIIVSSMQLAIMSSIFNVVLVFPHKESVYLSLFRYLIVYWFYYSYYFSFSKDFSFFNSYSTHEILFLLNKWFLQCSSKKFVFWIMTNYCNWPS